MKQNGAMLRSATSETVAANRAEIEGLHRENALLRDQLEDVKRQVEAVGFERGLADRVIAEQVFARISAARAARE